MAYISERVWRAERNAPGAQMSNTAMTTAGIMEIPTGICHPEFVVVFTKGRLMRVPHREPRARKKEIDPEKNDRTGAGASSAV